MTRPGIHPDIAERMEARASQRRRDALHNAIDQVAGVLVLGGVGYLILLAALR